jgi:hypothetical protein
MSMNNLTKILRKKALLYYNPIHGLTHWNTGMNNGLYLCEHSGANEKAVGYFVFFHD